MSKKILFYKAIIWQIIGLVGIYLFSDPWFGSWSKSVLFSIIVMIISVFVYVLYEVIWNKIIKKYKKTNP